MLTKETLKGVWAGVPSPWNEAGDFDEATFRGDVSRLRDAGVHGVYTTGGTGEFYAYDYDEFRRMVDAFADEVVGRIPNQVGCTWFNTRGVIQRAVYAAEKGIDGVQIAFPCWMPLTDRECAQFFKEVSAAIPHTPITFYNSAYSKRYLVGKELWPIIDAAPNIIGTKAAPTDFPTFMRMMIEVPDLAHFVGEGFLVPGTMFGAKGTYSSVVLWNPELMVHWFELCERKEWDKAIELQWKMARFSVNVDSVLAAADYANDPVSDKAMAEAAGFLKGSRQTRRPYLPVPDEQMKLVVDATLKTWPELLDHRHK